MLKSVIENVHGREIFDSRGNPTVEAQVTLSNGVMDKVNGTYQTNLLVGWMLIFQIKVLRKLKKLDV